MYKTLLIIIILCSSIILNKKIQINCPSYCECDFFEKYKRAVCIKKNLVMLQADIPQKTEILDLSFNIITHLEDYVFFEEKLLSLKLLNVSHNMIGQIHMNAFEGLDKLKTLDLSYNALQSILPNWFWSLKSLKELYLKGNHLSRLSDEPVFESKTLQILDISKCSISSIKRDAFIKVPNLRILDISQNYLIQLDVNVLSPLIKLEKLYIENNSFSCNNVMKNLANYCIKNNIKYKNPCIKRKELGVEKFQKIIVENTETEKKNSWIYDDDDNLKGKTENVSIISNCTMADEEMKETLLMRIINLSPILFVIIIFIFGILTGLIIGCSIQIKNPNRNEIFSTNWNNKSHLRRNFISKRNIEHEDGQTLMLSEWNLPESTPVVTRKYLM